MHSDDKYNLLMAAVIAFGIVAVACGIITGTTIAETEGNKIKLACIAEGKSVYNGDCIPDDVLIPGVGLKGK